MTKKQVVVVGFYGRGNIGDEAFKPAFKHLWGDRADFFFKDEIPNDLSAYDAMMIGGGSFLDQKMPQEAGMSWMPKDFPIGFVGVGDHGVIHPSWRPLLDLAKIIVKRNDAGFVDERVHYAPDLVFARPFGPPPWQGKKQLIVLGNDFLVPRRDSPHWKLDAWNWFEGEFAKTLDHYVEQDWLIRFVPMAGSLFRDYLDPQDDRVFAFRIASQMKNRHKAIILSVPKEVTLINEISGANLVFSLRFHGCVFSTILCRPFVAISHHDKIKDYMEDNELDLECVDYYGMKSKSLREAAEGACGDFQTLSDDYQRIREEGYEAWQDMSGIVAEALSL